MSGDRPASTEPPHTLDAPLRGFVALFDARDYWNAHEALEAFWQNDRRPLWQALIQIAAAFVHIEAGRWRGAASVLRRAVPRLAATSTTETTETFDVTRLHADACALLDHLEALRLDPNPALDPAHRLHMARYAHVPGTTVADGFESAPDSERLSREP